MALHLLQTAVPSCWYTTQHRLRQLTWAGLVGSRTKRILSTGLRSCRDRRLTNYDAGLGIAARFILTISRLAGASWVLPSRTACLSCSTGKTPLPPRMMGSCWCPRRGGDPRKDFPELGKLGSWEAGRLELELGAGMSDDSRESREIRPVQCQARLGAAAGLT